MDLSSIYLVENLTNYDFEDVVFLAADINTIVETLMNPVVLVEAEKTLFLAQVLKTALHICRTVVCNYSTLEDLLKMNWSAANNFAQKWKFYEQLAEEDPVVFTTRRILLSNEGVQCLGIIQEFYRMYYSKETFKETLAGIFKTVPSINANHAFRSVMKMLSGTEMFKGCRQQSYDINIVSLVNQRGSKEFRKNIEEFLQKLNKSTSEYLVRAQMQVLKMLFSNAKLMEGYNEALKCDAYYQLNLTVLKLYHDHLLTKNILYDTYVIMLLYLLRHNGTYDDLLRKEFLNEARLGGHERIRVVLLELQNFS